MAKSAILSVRIVGDAVGGIKAINDTGGAADGLFDKLKSGAGIALGIGTAIAAGAAAGTKALYDIGDMWNDVHETLRVGTGATGDDLEAMFDGVKNVASQIPAEIEDIGSTMADVNTRMGLSGDTLETVTSQYLEASRILGSEVDISATSAAFNAFDVAGEKVAGGLDHLFQVSQATGIGMNELATGVASNAPAVQSLGFSFEETAAMVGSFDKAGLNSSQIMSSMSRSLVNLAKDGEEPADAFQRVVGEIDGFIDAGDKASAIDLAGSVFGTRGASQFIGALETGALNLEDMATAAGQTSDTILGLGEETMNASEKWDVLKNKALVALEPIATQVFDGAAAALDWLMDLVDRVDLTPILDTIQGFVDGAGGALTDLQPYVDKVIDWFMNDLRPGIETLVGAFQDRFDVIVEIAGELVAGLQHHIEPLIPKVQNIFQTIGRIISGAVDLITALWDAGTSFILWAWERVGEPLIEVIGTTWTAIVDVIGPAMDTISAIIDTVLAVIDGDWSGAWEGIQNVASGIWDTITAVVSGAIDIVSSVISGTLDVIQGIWSGAWDTVLGFLDTAWENIKNAVSDGIDRLVDWFTELPGRITGAIRSLPGDMLQFGKDIIQGLIDGVKNMAGRAVDSVKGVIDDAVGAAKRLLGISSPSKVFATIGMQTGQGLVEGLLGEANEVARASEQLMGAVIPDRAPEIPLSVTGGRHGHAGGRAPVYITIDGALDPLGVARQIKELLHDHDVLVGQAA